MALVLSVGQTLNQSSSEERLLLWLPINRLSPLCCGSGCMLTHTIPAHTHAHTDTHTRSHLLESQEHLPHHLLLPAAQVLTLGAGRPVLGWEEHKVRECLVTVLEEAPNFLAQFTTSLDS